MFLKTREILLSKRKWLYSILKFKFFSICYASLQVTEIVLSNLMYIGVFFFFLKVCPFCPEIENNHPYLAGINLQTHAEQNELYIVDLIEVALNEPAVRTYMYCY